jgi:hypothetical protein
MTNSEYYRTLVIGVIIGASTVILGFSILKPETPTQPQKTQNNFAVVDTYKGCEVVRWALPSHAEYKYFLHCPK